MTHDVVIIGAGLSGLAAADALIKAGLSVRVVEARNRVGGRILTTSDGARAFDMGPAWIWPHDRRMLRLIDDLGLSVGDQYASGRLVFEAADGALRRDIEMATMAGSFAGCGRLAEDHDGSCSGVAGWNGRTGLARNPRASNGRYGACLHK